MSAPLTLLLEAHVVRVLGGAGSDAPSFEVPWTPDAPDAMADAVRARVGTSTDVVLVVGLAFLEIAQPELPPLDAASIRAVLWRDADRYFPLSEPIAVAHVDGFAFAMSARLLETWVGAMRAVGPVRAIVAAPLVCARLVDQGECMVSAGDGELGVVRAQGGRLQAVRRAATRAEDESGSASGDVRLAGHARGSTPLPMIDPTLVLRAARDWIDAPLESQLLHAPLANAIRRARRRRWLASAALAACAVLALLWSLDHRRDAQLIALKARAAELAERAAPAMLAESRGARARTELALLADAEADRVGPDAPLIVLRHLSRVLPRDAFVQRLEWNGDMWRVEGTADNAPRLVPLLDGDAHFRNVRIAAPSQRFLDVGRPRESFAVSFNVRASGGTVVDP